MRAIYQFARKSLLAAEWVVADTVAIEPVSAAKFPVIRENNWEFRQFGASSGNLGSRSDWCCMHFQ
jgi:hypothetical protein